MRRLFRSLPLRPLRLPRAAALLVLGAAPAAAGPGLIPIDDFEVGAFSLVATQGTLQDSVDVPGSWGHAIWSKRTVILDPRQGVGSTSASLAPDTNPNDYVALSISNTGSVRLRWKWGATGEDLTFGGAVDSLEVFLSGPVGGTVVARVQAAVGAATTSVTRTVPGPGAQRLVWALDQFDPGILTQSGFLEFEFSHPGVRHLLRAVRTRGRPPARGSSRAHRADRDRRAGGHPAGLPRRL